MFGNARHLQLIRNPIFRAVALNPDFAADKVDMKQVLLNAAIALPPYGSDNIMVTLSVEDGLIGDIVPRVAPLRVGQQNTLYDFSVMLAGIRWVISSVTELKTTSRSLWLSIRILPMPFSKSET